MFVYGSEFNGKSFHAISQPIKQRCQCNFTLFTSVNSCVMTLCSRGYVLLFWAVKVWGIKLRCGPLIGDDPGPMLNSLSLIFPRQSAGIWVIGNKQGLCACCFLFVFPSRGRLQVPWGENREEGAFLALRCEAQAHSSPNLLQRILSKLCRKSHCQGATNGSSEADWMTPPL